MKNYYNILRIDRKADSLMIKKAYRKLVLIYHPDKNGHPDAKRIFMDVMEAYDVLKDGRKRAEYDLFYDMTFRNSSFRFSSGTSFTSFMERFRTTLAHS